jgi:hypothetical protein
MLSPITELSEIESFQGNENPLIYKRTFELDLHCSFDLHWYPFDTQTCLIIVSIG